MARNKSGIDFLSHFAAKVIILIAASLAGCTIGSSISNYMASPYAIRWERLAPPPEKTTKILAADVDFVYVQSVTGKVYYWDVDRPGLWQETNSSAVRTRSGPTELLGFSPKPPENAIQISIASIGGELIQEAEFALTDDGQVWIWRHVSEDLFSSLERFVLGGLLGGLIGIVVGAVLLRTFVSRNNELTHPQWDGVDWRFVALWALLIPLVQLLGGSFSTATGLTELWRVGSIDYGRLLVVEAIGGACAAIAQWFVLRGWHYAFPGWVWITVLGYSIGAIARVATFQLFGGLFDSHSALLYVSPAIAAAIGQCFCLRQSLPRSALWVLVNAGAMIFGLSFIQADTSRMTAYIEPYITWAITGIVLSWLLRHPLTKEVQTPLTD